MGEEEIKQKLREAFGLDEDAASVEKKQLNKMNKISTIGK